MNQMIENIMSDIRSRAVKHRKRHNPQNPIAIWNEKDVIAEKIVDSMVVILNTSGCSWAKTSGCTMCGYFNDTSPEVTEEDFSSQIEQIRMRYYGQPLVKIFTSGSFTDPTEIPISVAQELMSFFSEKCKKICFESRTEYISPDSIEWLHELPCKIEVGLGLESTNERIREEIINKNIDFDDYVRAADLLHDAGIDVKTYLLLKPPLLSERDAIEDCVNSIKNVVPYSNTISVNPVNVQNFTFVDYLHHRGYYRPPWFYSLEEVFRQSLGLAKEDNVWLMSAPSGAGTKRGIHNCEKCNGKYIEAVKAISLGMMGTEVFDRIDCECRLKWYCDMDTQDAALDFISVG